jgi:signal transduction histidine kinase
VGTLRSDLLIALAGAAVGASGALLLGGGEWAPFLAAVALGAALGCSRLYPRATWLAAAGLLLFAGASGALPAGDDFTTYVLVGAHAFCAGRWDRGWGGYAAVVVLAAAGVACAALASSPVEIFVFIPPAGWGAGRALREREQVAEQLAQRARELEEEREAFATLSVRYERARIASELHDIVAHAISVMVIQASAGQRLAARDPEATAETFAAIAGAARQAEEDMGRLVALLGDAEATGPAPDLPLVEELVARAAGSGLDVTLRLEGDREGLPAQIAEVAYRVVQEGLTNALRYAAGAPVLVLLRGERELLVVEVDNDGATAHADLADAGTGNGLRGLRERVGACGGALDAGRKADGGWRVTARLPRRQGSSASASATLLGTTIRHASTTNSRISSGSRAASRTSTQL